MKLFAASETDVIQCRVVVVADSAFVRLDESFHSTNSVFTDVAVLAPSAISVAKSVDFIAVGAQETNIIGRRVVGLSSGRTDSQLETRHVSAESASLNSIEISSTVRI